MRGIVFTAALAFSPGMPAQPFTTELSGFEFFPGVASGDVHIGVVFGGWTGNSGNASPSSVFAPITATDGNTWQAEIAYRGPPGIRPDAFGQPAVNSVELVSGSFSLARLDGTRLHGVFIPPARVSWPTSLDTALDPRCGPGVAVVQTTLALENGGAPVGSLNGCLDDTHLDKVFPPKLWATLSANLP